MANALRKVSAHKTNQKVKSDEREVKNDAGGFTFKVSDADMFDRFLILGVCSGTYQAGNHSMLDNDVNFIKKFIKENPSEAIRRTVDVSTNGRAKSNSTALFVLAQAMNTDGVKKSDVSDAVKKVARTSTHLFEYAQYLKNLGGWGRAKRASIAGWYESKSNDALAMQVVKYRQRDGWTHRDLFRLGHPKGIDTSIGDFILGKDHAAIDDLRTIHGFKLMQQAKNIDEVVELIKEYRLPWETVPTQFHKDVKLWRALFESNALGQTALLRNTVRMAKLGAFKDLKFAGDYAERLADANRIQKGLVHPINYLNAAVVYSEGQVNRKGHYAHRESRTWDTSSSIKDALNEGFHSAFKFVEPSNERYLVGVDVSGSMGSMAMGLDLSCAQVSGAVAMQIARTAKYSEIRGFTSGGYGWRDKAQLTDLGITAKSDLADAMNKVRGHNFGGTDCAQPMLWALENGVEIDTFVVITDNETWAGDIKPHQALKQYRKETGINAKLAVLGVEGRPFTIADGSKHMLDFVGFDSNAPKALADFSAGRI
jgi:60 kDa SS-A/Ro ribonucleoprotein